MQFCSVQSVWLKCLILIIQILKLKNSLLRARQEVFFLEVKDALKIVIAVSLWAIGKVIKVSYSISFFLREKFSAQMAVVHIIIKCIMANGVGLIFTTCLTYSIYLVQNKRNLCIKIFQKQPRLWMTNLIFELTSFLL